jgi:hypothetical protein
VTENQHGFLSVAALAADRASLLAAHALKVDRAEMAPVEVKINARQRCECGVNAVQSF